MKTIKPTRLIKFKRSYNDFWEIAFDEKQLCSKLNGDMAEIIMPAKNVFVRMWRKIFPLKGKTMNLVGKSKGQ